MAQRNIPPENIKAMCERYGQEMKYRNMERIIKKEG